MKKVLIAITATFVTWSILDFIVHVQLLQSTYEATADLWRPMEEMKTVLMHIVTLIIAIIFVSIYALFCQKPSIHTGLKFGALIGLFYGLSMGWGSYCYMPIPLSLALSWFIGVFVEMCLGGLIIGKILAKKG